MLKKRPRGFTIVELLIVIVVIAILAAITIVAYNGVQTRAKNTKTINATTAWVKALKLYNADTGLWPTVSSCFGSATTYQGSGGQCWNGTTWIVNSTFTSQVQPYMNGTPEPDTTDIATTNSPRRGAFYQVNSTLRYIWMSLPGATSCPDLGMPLIGSGAETNGMYCYYHLATV